MQIEANRVYTFDEVLEILKLSPGTLRRLVKKGVVPATRLGKQYRFLGSELLRTLEESGQKGGRGAEESDKI